MRNLEALMIVADRESMLVISGTGEVIEPDQDFVAIGSGGNYAYSAANALFNHTNMTAEEIVRESLKMRRLYAYIPMTIFPLRNYRRG